MEDNWTNVYSTNKPYQADIIIELLDEKGIVGVVINKEDSSYLSFGLAEVYVNKNDEENALSIIKSSTL
jgi:hypothetical protein